MHISFLKKKRKKKEEVEMWQWHCRNRTCDLLWKYCKNIVDVTTFFYSFIDFVTFFFFHFRQWHCHNCQIFFSHPGNRMGRRNCGNTIVENKKFLSPTFYLSLSNFCWISAMVLPQFLLPILLPAWEKKNWQLWQCHCRKWKKKKDVTKSVKE